jgi:hypothetical protein
MNSSKTKNPVGPTQANNKASKKRRNRNRAAKKLNKAGGPPVTAYPLPTYSNTGMRQLSRIPKSSLTPAGEAFLKCAFAPPDFAASSSTGVPDEFRGQSLLKKHRYVGNFACNLPNQDYYILMIPTVGGVAYWSTNTPAGGQLTAPSVFTPTYYSDSQSLFPTVSNMADIVTKYRFVSNHIELIPMMNQNSWTGSIQVWKAPITCVIRQSSTSTTNMYTVTGLQSANATNANQYTGPTNLGVYSAAYNASSVFTFNPILENIASLPLLVTPGDFGQLNGINGGIDPNFESIIVKISGMGPNNQNNFVLKTWACIEYQVNPGSSIYEYQTISPCDEYALKLYRAIVLQLPVGVSFLDNDTFWTRVLGIIKNVSGGLSYVPGPYGAIAAGVNMAANGIESLVI